MLDQVKVNQNGILNLLKTPERGGADFITKNAGVDFLSMVMEKTGTADIKPAEDNRNSRVSEQRKNGERPEAFTNTAKDSTPDSTRINSRDREVNSSDEQRSKAEEKTDGTVKNEKTGDTHENDTKKIDESNVKDIKTKKTNKNPEDETGISNQLQSGIIINNLMEIIRAASIGNKKGEEENYSKLFSNLKLNKDKENQNHLLSSRKTAEDKNQKSLPELLNAAVKDFKETIGREIFKSLENRKGAGKPQQINDKELKEIASNIIETVKKNRAKETVRHDAKSVTAEDIRNDRKPPVQSEQQSVKRTDIHDDSSSDKNSGKDRNQGKENFSFNSSKMDFSGKNGTSRIEQTMKMPDFRENLQEVIDRAKVTVRDSRNGTFTMKLNPQELGNVNVNLIMENGVINGKFLVDNEDAKGMLLSNLNDLKYQLEQSGISVGEFSVNVSDQREKYLRQQEEDYLRTLSSMNTNGEVTAAAEQYDSGSAAHTGHINLVI